MASMTDASICTLPRLRSLGPGNDGDPRGRTPRLGRVAGGPGVSKEVVKSMRKHAQSEMVYSHPTMCLNCHLVVRMFS